MDFFDDANFWFSLTVTLLYILRFRAYGWDYKYFSLTLVTYAVITLGMQQYLAVTGENNIFFFHPYILFEFIFLTLFYRELLQNKKITYIIYPVSLFLLLQYILNPSLIFNYNTLGVLVTHSLIIVLSLLYMYRCLSNSGPFSLINLGVFVYIVSVTLFFISGNLVWGDENEKEVVIMFGKIHDVIYFLFQLLVFIEWWRKFYRVKTN